MLTFARTATRLNDGTVLVTGGFDQQSCFPSCAVPVFASAEILTRKTVWSATGSMSVAQADHSAALLHNGDVLVAGSLTTARETHTEVRLHGKVLVAKGINVPFPVPAGFPALASAEVYEPKTGTWSAIASMSSPRFVHTATLPHDGAGASCRQGRHGRQRSTVGRTLRPEIGCLESHRKPVDTTR